MGYFLAVPRIRTLLQEQGYVGLEKKRASKSFGALSRSSSLIKPTKGPQVFNKDHLDNFAIQVGKPVWSYETKKLSKPGQVERTKPESNIAEN